MKEIECNVWKFIIHTMWLRYKPIFNIKKFASFNFLTLANLEQIFSNYLSKMVVWKRFIYCEILKYKRIIIIHYTKDEENQANFGHGKDTVIITWSGHLRLDSNTTYKRERKYYLKLRSKLTWCFHIRQFLREGFTPMVGGWVWQISYSQ